MLAPESNGEGNAFPAIAVLAISPARNNAVAVTARPASGGPPVNWRWTGRGGAWVVYINTPQQAGGPAGSGRQAAYCLRPKSLISRCGAGRARRDEPLAGRSLRDMAVSREGQLGHGHWVGAWLAQLRPPGQVITAPPVTSRIVPVIQAASPEARNTAALATSCVVPSRFSGWYSAMAACWAGGIRSWLRSVRIVSGAMQFTLIPCGPAWAATSWVS